VSGFVLVLVVVLVSGHAEWSGFDCVERCRIGFLSRGDYRTEPGVLTPGIDQIGVPPRKGGRSVPSGCGGCGQTNNRTKNLAPLQGASWVGVSLGLKPQAQSFCPFGTEIHFSIVLEICYPLSAICYLLFAIFTYWPGERRWNAALQ
jgi:hypothetical protein